MQLQIFESQEFGSIRTITEADGTVLFCGSDVAKALGYTQTAKAVRDHCREDGCLIQTVIDTLGRRQKARFITEGNVYRLILRSKLPSAALFEKWVVETVLPTIRKHGAYIAPEILDQLIARPELASQLASMLKNTQEQNHDLQVQVAEMEPKALYYDTMVDTNLLTNIRQTAKELNLPEKLFVFLLLDMNLAYRTPKGKLMPYAPLVNHGFVELKEYVNNGHGGVYMLFTPKGRLAVMHKIQKRLALRHESQCSSRQSIDIL